MHCRNTAEKMSDNQCLERLGLSLYKRDAGLPQSSAEGHKDEQGLDHLPCEERLKRAGTVQPEEEGKEYHINIYKYLKAVCKEDKAQNLIKVILSPCTA